MDDGADVKQPITRHHCMGCLEQMPLGECSHSKQPCGHHCDCSWTQDACCYCGKTFGTRDEETTNLKGINMKVGPPKVEEIPPPSMRLSNDFWYLLPLSVYFIFFSRGCFGDPEASKFDEYLKAAHNHYVKGVKYEETLEQESE